MFDFHKLSIRHFFLLHRESRCQRWKHFPALPLTYCSQTYKLAITTSMPPFFASVTMEKEHPHLGWSLHWSSGALLSQSFAPWLDQHPLSLSYTITLPFPFWPLPIST